MKVELTVDEQWLVEIIRYCQKNLVDVIATTCGWLPLTLDEKMTVTYGEKRYEIRRIK